MRAPTTLFPLLLQICASSLLLVSLPDLASAKSPASCAGVAMAGGAQLICSQPDAKAMAQFCTYSWALVTPTNAIQIVQGSFLLPPRASNVQVYQGSGFSSASSNPIVLCRGQSQTP